MNMYVQCPECDAVYAVTKREIKESAGEMQCVHCDSVFKTKGHLHKKPPGPITPFVPEMEEERDEPDTLPPELRASNETEGTRWGSLIGWSLVALLLIAVLIGQYVWFMERDYVLRHPQIRPLLTNACSIIVGCRLPPIRDPDQFRMENHLVQSHPEQANALEFNATFINTAQFAQPYPQLRLTFEDLNGEPVAQRLFQPAEYLALPDIEQRQIPPGGSTHAQLAIIDLAASGDGEKLLHGYHFEFF